MQYHHHHHYQKKISLIEEIGKVNIQKGKNIKKPNPRFWIKHGKTNEWWKGFLEKNVIIEEWRENVRMSYDTFMKLFFYYL